MNKSIKIDGFSWKTHAARWKSWKECPEMIHKYFKEDEYSIAVILQNGLECLFDDQIKKLFIPLLGNSLPYTLYDTEKIFSENRIQYCLQYATQITEFKPDIIFLCIFTDPTWILNIYMQKIIHINDKDFKTKMFNVCHLCTRCDSMDTIEMFGKSIIRDPEDPDVRAEFGTLDLGNFDSE